MITGKYPAVFLDRDGVIIAEKSFQIDPDKIEFLPGAIEGLGSLGIEFIKVVVSNQSGVARGYFSIPEVERFQSSLDKKLRDKEISIAGWYYCPHGPDDACECRKPKPGLILRAAQELSINLVKSWMVGDKSSDILAGAAAGLKTVLVKTGYGGLEPGSTPVRPDHTAENLLEAINIINKGMQV